MMSFGLIKVKMTHIYIVFKIALLYCVATILTILWHDVVIKWKHFPRYWPFVRGIHRSPHKGQWRGALMFSLICTRINGWVNNREAGDLRRHRAHYDVIVMGWEVPYVLRWIPFSRPCWLCPQRDSIEALSALQHLVKEVNHVVKKKYGTHNTQIQTKITENKGSILSPLPRNT